MPPKSEAGVSAELCLVFSFSWSWHGGNQVLTLDVSAIVLNPKLKSKLSTTGATKSGKVDDALKLASFLHLSEGTRRASLGQGGPNGNGARRDSLNSVEKDGSAVHLPTPSFAEVQTTLKADRQPRRPFEESTGSGFRVLGFVM